MYCNEEKENESDGFRNLHGSFVPMSKATTTLQHEKVMTKQRVSAFGRLLSDATADAKQAQIAHDEKCASKSLIDDACDVTASWIRESQDKVLARETQERLIAEDKQKRRQEEKDGENAALRVAMDERNRIRKQQQEKASKEIEDREYARKVILADIDAECEFKSLCDNDSNVAKEVYERIQDELFAEKLHEEELNEMAIYKQKQIEMAEADAKFAMEQQEAMEKEANEIRRNKEETDADYARVQQKLHDQAVSIKREQQSSYDAAVARKIQVQLFRQEHRDKMRQRYMNKHTRVLGANLTETNIAMISKAWEEAEALIEDVSDGICITIELPYLNNLRVRTTDFRTVEIEATRVKFADDKGRLDTRYNAVEHVNYSADFIIEGDGVNLDDTCLSYEYLSDTGLLHVYCDSVSLSKAKDEVKASVVDSLKGSFKRLFSGK